MEMDLVVKERELRELRKQFSIFQRQEKNRQRAEKLLAQSRAELKEEVMARIERLEKLIQLAKEEASGVSVGDLELRCEVLNKQSQEAVSGEVAFGTNLRQLLQNISS